MLPINEIIRKAQQVGIITERRNTEQTGGASPQSHTHQHAMIFPALILDNGPGLEPGSAPNIPTDPGEIWPRAYSFLPMTGYYPMPDYGAPVGDFPLGPNGWLNYKFDPIYKGPAMNIAELWLDEVGQSQFFPGTFVARPRPVPYGTPVIMYRGFDFQAAVVLTGAIEQPLQNIRFLFHQYVDPLSTTCTPYP